MCKLQQKYFTFFLPLFRISSWKKKKIKQVLASLCNEHCVFPRCWDACFAIVGWLEPIRSIWCQLTDSCGGCKQGRGEKQTWAAGGKSSRRIRGSRFSAQPLLLSCISLFIEIIACDRSCRRLTLALFWLSHKMTSNKREMPKKPHQLPVYALIVKWSFLYIFTEDLTCWWPKNLFPYGQKAKPHRWCSFFIFF